MKRFLLVLIPVVFSVVCLLIIFSAPAPVGNPALPDWLRNLLGEDIGSGERSK